MFGNPETTTGGRALKFYASLRLEIRRVASIKGADNIEFGNRVKVKVVKNKLAPPFRSAEFDIIFNEGISHTGSVIDVGIEYGILEKKGTWLTYKDKRFQGREAARRELMSNPGLVKELEQLIFQKSAQMKDKRDMGELAVEDQALVLDEAKA
jgi:recombination protein RecA